MAFVRKLNRKKRMEALKEMGIYCCGGAMQRKEGYDTEDKYYYFCEVCGKEKYVSKNGVIVNE